MKVQRINTIPDPEIFQTFCLLPSVIESILHVTKNNVYLGVEISIFYLGLGNLRVREELKSTYSDNWFYLVIF